MLAWISTKGSTLALQGVLSAMLAMQEIGLPTLSLGEAHLDTLGNWKI